MKVYQVKVTNNKYKETLTVTGDKTLRDVFETADIAYEDGLINFNGSTIRPNELDRALDEFDLNDAKTQTLSAVRKETQAVTGDVIGNTLVITSGINQDDFNDISTYYPKSTKLYDEDLEEIYQVNCSAAGDGSINKFGAVFGRPNANGYPTITVSIPEEVTDVKEFVKPYAFMLKNIIGIEEQMNTYRENAAAAKAEIENMIQIH